MKKGTLLVIFLGLTAVMFSCDGQKTDSAQDIRKKAMEAATDIELAQTLAPPLGAKWVKFTEGKVGHFGLGYGDLGFDFGAMLDVSEMEFESGEEWSAGRSRQVARHFAREVKSRIPGAHIVRGMEVGQKACFFLHMLSNMPPGMLS